MRVMAIDYGESRTGVAISDRMGVLCGKAFVIAEKNRKKLVEEIVRLYHEHGVGCAVVGHPLHMDGRVGERAAKSQEFCAALQARGLETELWDERRTSVDAAAILHQNGRHGAKNRARVDAVAAALILEGYLNRAGQRGES